jgi:hypothetical protein
VILGPVASLAEARDETALAMLSFAWMPAVNVFARYTPIWYRSSAFSDTVHKKTKLKRLN